MKELQLQNEETNKLIEFERADAAYHAIKTPERIGSVTTFLRALEQLPHDKDYEYYFRGHSNAEYQLIPSLYRDKRYIDNEHRMFREIILRCPNEFHELETTFQKLVKMQHYALPTRLLDLTGNPLIALFFACVSLDKKKDGEVIIFRIPKSEIKYFDSDTVSVISNISKQPDSFHFQVSVNQTPEEFSAQESIKLLIHDIQQERSGFEPKIKADHLQSVIFVKPMQDNARIMRQDGAFLLFGVLENKNKPAIVEKSYTDIQIGASEKFKLIINANEKQKMILQLESLGINTGKIYPEIETVSQYIRGLYKTV